MGEIVNLRQVRKAKARAVATAKAASNRAMHGRTKAEKARDEAEAARIEATLRGARIEPDGVE